MVQTETMSKDSMFKFRLDDADRRRLDEVAAHFSASAATAIRILIKEKADALAAAKDPELGKEHQDVLYQFSDDVNQSLEAGDMAIGLNRLGWDARMPWLGRALNQLRDGAFLQKRGGKYTLTPKGKAYAQANWKPADASKR